MAYSVEPMKNDCKEAFEIFHNHLLQYRRDYPLQIRKIENWDKLQYTSDEKYFQFRREFNGRLMEIFTEHRDKSFVIELDDVERKCYFLNLQSIEKHYFTEAILFERNLIGHN